jgi:endonuclease YncB( thermonuclease family)
LAAVAKPPLDRWLKRTIKRPALRRAFALGLLGIVAFWQCYGAPQAPAAETMPATQAVTVDACQPTGAFDSVQIEKVIDGDTVHLADQRRVRVIGLNTPERGEPYSRAASDYIRQLPAAGWQLQQGEDALDHYRRTLADLVMPDGQLLSVALIEKGLAFAVYFPPNLRYAECIEQAEQRARALRQGVWAEPAFAPLQASDLRGATAGFHRVQGVVTDVTPSRGGWWIQLDGDVVWHIAKSHAAYFRDDEPTGWRGRRLEAGGWLVDRHKGKGMKTKYSRWMMSVRYPASVHRLSDR